MTDKTKLIFSEEKRSILISKIKVKNGTSLYEGKIILFYQVDYNNPSKKKTKQLKAKDAGCIISILVKEGEIVDPEGGLYTYKSGCSHPTIMNDLCAECGLDLRKDEKGFPGASIPMVHTIPMLKVSAEQAQILGKADEVRLIKDRKLVLLVDLDQTLIHTTNDDIPANIKDVHHFQLHGSNSTWYHTRLRPGTLSFLESISKWYELHICTFGSRNYAHRIAHFLDKNGKYFSHRILSRDECFDFHSKTANLKALFPCGDNLVCIIDDREDVWNYSQNLIHVKPYHFFRHTGDINAPPGLTKNETDDTVGYTIAQLAQGIHVKQNNKTEQITKESQSRSINAKENMEEEKCDKDYDKGPDNIESKSTILDVNVEEKLKSLEEEISNKHKEIVSIVVKSSDDLADDSLVNSQDVSNDNRHYSSFVEQVCPDSTQVDEYVPSIQTSKESDDYVPTMQSNCSEAQYVPTVQSKTTKSNEYVPPVLKNMETDENIDSDSNVPSSEEYVPSKTEYIPSDTAHTEYVPSVVPDEEYEPTSIKCSTLQEYIPTSSKSDDSEYFPSSTCLPDQTDAPSEYIPSSITSNKSKPPIYIPSSIKSSDSNVDSSIEKNEYVPSESDISLDSPYVPRSINTEEMEYVPTGVDSLDSTKYVPSKIGEAVEKIRESRINQFDDLIEVEEVDDYLLYLEEILKHIHQQFYEVYDKTFPDSAEKSRSISSALPDLKAIIPSIRSNVLKNVFLVFSGVVPSKMQLEQNKAYLVATSLGATVTHDINSDTTHLVAVRPGTAKVNEARKRKLVKIVTLDWLWMCAERWEHVDERLFPISHKVSASRTPPAHCASPEHRPSSPLPPEDKFSDTINPLMTLSSEELANMDKEVEDMFDESDEDDELEEGQIQSGKRKRKESSSSSAESLSGDRKGWSSPNQIVKLTAKRRKRKQKEVETSSCTFDLDNDVSYSDGSDIDSKLNEEDGESINSKFRRCAKLPSDVEFESSQGSAEEDDTMDDIEWNMMGAALEREFTAN